MFSEIFNTENVNFVLQNPKKFDFSDWHFFSFFSTDRTYSFGASNVYGNYQYGKFEFLPPNAKKIVRSD
jgi:hypothetical protein